MGVGASRARIASALGVLWLVWGSTYLAVRVLVRTMPPLLSGSLRFLVAGAVLFLFAKREGLGWRQWRAAAIVGAGLVLFGNGSISLAAVRLPAGVVALLAATVPLWMAVIDATVLRRRLGGREWAGVLIGFVGVAGLVGAPGSDVHLPSALIGLFGPMAWACGSLYARHAPLPSGLAAPAMQMLCGGAMLGIAGFVAGDRIMGVSFESGLAWGYLVVFGSILTFSCYLWLLRAARTSLVSTYAYVNPVVAVILGSVLLREGIGARVLVAGAVIVLAVALIVSAGRERADAGG